VRPDPADPTGYVEVLEAPGLATLYRGGQALVARPGFTLKADDQIETGRDTSVIISFPDGGNVVLKPLSRVRLGSLYLLFGSIFASVRGLFSVEGQNFVAGVEATEFLFAVGGGDVRVVVLDGVVVCQSKTKAWDPVRLGAGQQLIAPLADVPLVQPANPSELADLRAWVDRVKQAPRAGYCCVEDRVYPAKSNQCPGVFGSSEAEARRSCAIFQSGWCCDRGRVTQGIRAGCGGEFFFDLQSANRACAAPPEPTGWCCQDGKVTSETPSQCHGSFHPDQKSAEVKCRPLIQ